MSITILSYLYLGIWSALPFAGLRTRCTLIYGSAPQPAGSVPVGNQDLPVSSRTYQRLYWALQRWEVGPRGGTAAVLFVRWQFETVRTAQALELRTRMSSEDTSAESRLPVMLREVTADTVRAVCTLKVAPDQVWFVAPNAVSIAEAYFDENA